MKKKLNLIILCLTALVMVMAVTPVWAQQSDYRVHLQRNFGYGGGSNIRGTFTISLVGDETAVDTVRFRIDGEEMAIVNEPPFSFKFHTDDYGVGTHALAAEVALADGRTLVTESIQYRFVSPETERQEVVTVVAGIVGSIVVVMLLVGVIQSLILKRGKKGPHRPGQPRNYGVMGGTICPKCGLPFPRHIWGLNLMVGRLDRCEHCGKWVMTTRAAPDALAAAEQALTPDDADAQPPVVSRKDEDDLEESKYIDQI
jgi:hypothetical protein